jgi:hypothetical protein
MTIDNGMLVLVHHLLSLSKGCVWQVERVKGKVCDKVREREKIRGK